MGRQDDHERSRASDDQQLERLLLALPVTALLVSPGGALIEPRAGHGPDEPVIDYVWELPAFSDTRDRASLFSLLGRAQDGESLQIEHDYTATRRTPAGTLAGTTKRRRGLLSLSPIYDEDGLVDLIALTLIDCEDHALPVLGPREPSRIHAAQDRVDSVLALAQAVIETSYVIEHSEDRPPEPAMREALSARLHRCASCSDALCRLDETQISTPDLLEFGMSAQERDRLELTCSNEAVPIRLVPALSLLLSELAANATKHGAWRDADGRVQLTLSRRLSGGPDAMLELVWSETAGRAVQTPTTPGFGLRYARSVLPELYGAQVELSVEPTGYRWQISLPLRAEARRAEEDFARFDGGYDGELGAYDRDAERG